MSKHLSANPFNKIRYSNCWEDPNILLKGLSAQPGGRILSVGSAGDNSFSLLTTYPEFVIAADISLPQIYLIQLKKSAIEVLSHTETLEFLGFRKSKRLEEFYFRVRKNLPYETQRYWDQNKKFIREGLTNQGKFEKYLIIFSRFILPLIHSKKLTDCLLHQKTETEQKVFYDDHWNSFRWKLLMKIFFSRFIMGRLGRAPEFMEHVNIPVSEYIFNKTESHLKSVLATTNPMLHFALKGNFGNHIPHYLSKEAFPLVKSNINRLKAFHGYVEIAIKESAPFDYMNLSNIFEYMDDQLFQEVSEKIISGCSSGAKVAYWNLMVPRRISGSFPEKVSFNSTLSEQLTSIDNGFFYDRFILDKIT